MQYWFRHSNREHIATHCTYAKWSIKTWKQYYSIAKICQTRAIYMGSFQLNWNDMMATYLWHSIECHVIHFCTFSIEFGFFFLNSFSESISILRIEYCTLQTNFALIRQIFRRSIDIVFKPPLQFDASK